MIIDKSLLYINKNDRVQESTTENLFQYSFEALLEANNDIIRAIEANSYVTEDWVSDVKRVFNFYDILSAIVNGFIKVIEELIGRFLSILVKLGSMGKSFELELKGFANKIKTFKGSFKVEDVFIYTNLEPGQFPDSGLKTKFKDSLNKFIDNFNNAVDHSSDAASAIMKLEESDFDLQEEASKFRSYLLQLPEDYGFVSPETFGQECFKVFRNGKISPYEYCTYTKSNLYYKHYIPYTENSKLQAQTKKDSKRIENDCREAKKAINKFTPNIAKFGENEHDNILNVYNKVQRNICTLFDLECKDVVTLYSSKLQAYKESYIQDRRILTKCMQEIAKGLPVTI